MTIIALVSACLLAAAGAACGEWVRRRRGWAANIAVSYGSAMACSVAIVLTQAAVQATTDGGAAARGWSFLASLLIACVIGPLLHGVAWVLVVVAWDQMRIAVCRGRRTPRA